MINFEIFDDAIEIMKYDIESTNLIFLDNLPENIHDWYYYISIHTNDELGLNRVSKLLERLKVSAKKIIMVPSTYKSCEFDCFTISSIFSNIHSNSSYNIDTISIVEQSSLEEGDFYISIVRQNKHTMLMDIMSYRSYISYCEQK